MSKIRIIGNKDKTGNDRQSRLRQMRKQFIKSCGFNSVEGIVGALVRGEKFLVDTKTFTEIIDDLDGLEDCCFCRENHYRGHDSACPVFLLTKIIPTVKGVPTQRAADGALPSGLEESWEVGSDGNIKLTKFTPRR